jgi:hypothetical protein
LPLLVLVLSFLTLSAFSQEESFYDIDLNLVIDEKEVIHPNWNNEVRIRRDKNNLPSVFLNVVIPNNYKIMGLKPKALDAHYFIPIEKLITNHQIVIEKKDGSSLKASLLIKMSLKKSRIFLSKDCEKILNVSAITTSDQPEWKFIDCKIHKNDVLLESRNLFQSVGYQHLKLNDSKMSSSIGNANLSLRNKMLSNIKKIKKLRLGLSLTSKKTHSANDRLTSGLFGDYRFNLQKIRFRLETDIDVLSFAGRLANDNEYLDLGIGAGHNNLVFHINNIILRPELKLNYRYHSLVGEKAYSNSLAFIKLKIKYSDFYFSPEHSLLSSKSYVKSYGMLAGVRLENHFLQMRYNFEDYDSHRLRDFSRWSLQIGKFI